MGSIVGITHSPTFTKHCTHLLCPSRTGAKFEKAGEWGVPIVDWGWVEEVVKTGIVPLTARENRNDEKEGGKDKGKEREKERSTKLKGKGKERAVEVDAPVDTDTRMVDITNGACLSRANFNDSANDLNFIHRSQFFTSSPPADLKPSATATP